MRILVVDDDANGRFLMSRYLEKIGHQVMLAINGKEAVELCRAEQFDIIFMDVNMPVVNGFDATHAIREQQGDGYVTPIVALTAYAMSDDRQRCLDNGMDDYLSKPVNLIEIQNMVQKWQGKNSEYGDGSQLF